jgi:hypothetical protein
VGVILAVGWEVIVDENLRYVRVLVVLVVRIQVQEVTDSS